MPPAADEVVEVSSNPREVSSNPRYPPNLRTTLISIITREFKKHTGRDIIVSKIRDALIFGSKAERCLRLALADPPEPTELARMTAFVNLYRKPGKAPLRRLQTANITVQPTPKPRRPKQPVNPNILMLPHNLRYKATLVGGGTIRYTGTKQSPVVSGILRKKIHKKLVREDQLEHLKSMEEAAVFEDLFEKQVRKNAGKEWREENPPDDLTYRPLFTTAAQDVQAKMFRQVVATWHRAGKCLELIEAHQKRAKELIREGVRKRKLEMRAAAGLATKNDTVEVGEKKKKMEVNQAPKLQKEYASVRRVKIPQLVADAKAEAKPVSYEELQKMNLEGFYRRDLARPINRIEQVDARLETSKARRLKEQERIMVKREVEAKARALMEQRQKMTQSRKEGRSQSSKLSLDKLFGDEQPAPKPANSTYVRSSLPKSENDSYVGAGVGIDDDLRDILGR
ncbi:hypothetical protein ABW20_dc0100998 [Dactylellina cionopaga]|nr:hypothetical protein ABW20_dc0100998 [Dactylellina cionopaga]